MSYTQTKVSMKQRETIEVNTSDNAKLGAKEPTLPVFIPMRIVRWLVYSAFMCLLLIPAMWDQEIKITVSIALVLGHFASQLNALINKKQ
jgi:hypothetical protein